MGIFCRYIIKKIMFKSTLDLSFYLFVELQYGPICFGWFPVMQMDYFSYKMATLIVIQMSYS